MTVENGVSVLRSTKNSSAVAVALLSRTVSADLASLPSFAVAIVNRTAAPLVVSPANFTAYSGRETIPIYTRAELSRKLAQANRESAARARSAALTQARFTARVAEKEAQAAAELRYTALTAPGAQPLSRPVPGPSEIARLTTSAAKSSLPTQIGGLLQADFNHIRLDQISHARSQAEYVGCMLKAEKIPPGQVVNGVIRLDGSKIKRGQPLTLSAAIAGETYEFHFAVGP